MKNLLFLLSICGMGACFGAGGDEQFYKYTNYNPDAKESSILFEDFVSPKGKSRVQTWWHWINANVSREGIEKDLEAMGKNNFGAAIIFNVSSGSTPEGPLKFNSKDWFDTFKFVVDTADKNGLEIGIHNCDGWSEAGGPWITPEYSMKVLTSSRARVKSDGSAQRIVLPRPAAYSDHYKNPVPPPYYEDIAVLAYPAFRPEKVDMFEKIADIKPSSSQNARLPKNFGAMFDGNIKSVYSVGPNTPDFSMYGIDIEFESPYEASAAYINTQWTWRKPLGIFIAVSDDGKNFRKISVPKFGSNEVFVNFPSTTAKYWRIGRELKKKDIDAFQMFLRIAELELIPSGRVARNAPYITQLLPKVAAAKNNFNVVYDDAKVPEKAIINPKKIKFFNGKIGADNSISWRLPAGEWEVVRVGYTTNGVGVHPASPSGRGLESDKLSAEATDHHFDSYISKMIDAAGSGAGRVFKYVETDSWECGAQNWTQKMPEEFRKLNGYDIMPWLPAMLGEVVESKEATERFAADLRSLTAHLVVKNFYGRLGERIRARGLKYESEPTSELSLKDSISLFKQTDIPQNEIWQEYRNLKSNAVPNYNPGREVAAAAQFFGKGMATCESLTQVQGNWSDAPLPLKGAIDTILLSGMNAIVFHSYTHQPDERVPGWQMEPWGSCINRKMPWFGLSRDFFDYISRSQYMLQQGKADIHVLKLVTEELPMSAEMSNLPKGFYSNKINADCVKNYLRVKGGKLVSPGRIEYDFLELDPRGVFKADTLGALKSLVSGGAVVCAENPPKYRTLAGGKAAEKTWKKLADELFGGGGKRIVEIGKGKVYVGYSASETAKILGLRPAYITSENGVAVVKREHIDGTVWYYVVNCSPDDKAFDISFDVSGKRAEIWNPETAEKAEVVQRRESGGYTRIPLYLRRNDAVFVVFSGEAKYPSVAEALVDGKRIFPKSASLKDAAAYEEMPRFIRNEAGGYSAEFFSAGTAEVSLSDGSSASASVSSVREAVKIGVPFTVRFDDRYGAPKSAEFGGFASWTEHPDGRVKNYSGVGVYDLKAHLPKISGDERAYLSFGSVMEIGRVKVNGNFAGTLWKRPYTLDITKFVKEGVNDIEVEVGNTWVNRCLYDATLPPEKRLTWANTMPFHFPEKGKKAIYNQGMDKSWKQGPIPSGIIGKAQIEFSKISELK